ncbi:hypothetical protein EVG20_g8472 [Dentipellis fragilis]|uniref:Uncharacterized protein n=1 Tax=Dentipellis fragilis TaxID=205917 RepID=A0A4Y9Y7T4_9AGAM|nr:hypothetical protein EVG20_g8472 [Dentipellis fragilis]
MVTTRRQARGEASPAPSSPAPSPPAPSSPAPPPSEPASTQHIAKEDLPPTKTDKGLRNVSPPLRGVYHAAQMAVDLVKGTVPSVPGFGLGWGLGFSGRDRKTDADSGARGGAGKEAGSGSGTVESRIEELARALGVKSPELANAIAGAVREYVPPASLSSIANQAKKTGGSKVVEALVGKQGGAGERPSQGVMGGVSDTLGKVVGMDDVPGAV